MITVLMAAKTSTEYMPQAIGSLLGQSYTDWHLVIGINGLPPGHDAERDAKNYTYAFPSRRTIVTIPDCQDKAEALNRMMEFADGDYIALLDVDDLWHPLKLERQMPFLRVGYDVVGTEGSYFGLHQNSIGVVKGQIDLTSLLYENCIINSSAVIQREHCHWESFKGRLEDYQLWLRIAYEGHKLYNVSQQLTFIRQHAGNWSKGEHQFDVETLRKRYVQ